MGPIEMFKLYRDWNKVAKQAKEMTMQNWKTTLFGLIGGVALALANYSGANTWNGYLAAAAVAAIGILAKDFNVNLSADEIAAVKQLLARTPAVLLAIGLLFMLGARLNAQAVAPAPTGTVAFTPASFAIYVDLDKTSSVGNLTTETLNVTTHCGVEGAELLAPGVNLQGYYAGAACTPDLSKLFAKTLIPSNAFSFSFAADAGWVLNTTSNASTRNTSGLFRGCATYNLGSSGVIAPVCAGYLYAPGFGTSPHGFVFSVGLGKVFGSL